LLYFAVTTLTTVGFGDFHPRSDGERIIVTIILLLGVGVFGSFIGTFWEMLQKYHILTGCYEDSS